MEVRAMKGKKMLAILLFSMVIMVACSNDSDVIEDVSRGADVPQVGVTGDELSAEERMEFILNSSNIIHNIVVGRPIEFIEGNRDVIPFLHHVSIDEINTTEYYFEVSEWLFGEIGEDVIRVTSIAGNIFEIGEEYTIALWYADSLFHNDTWYNVESQVWTLPSLYISEPELIIFHNEVRNLPPNKLEKRRVISEAEPTLEFLEHVDLAFIATIRDVQQGSLIDTASLVQMELQQMIYGDDADGMREHLQNQGITWNGDFTIGNDYLFLTKDNLLPTSRHGSAIPYGSDEFYQFMELFDSIE